MRRASVYSLINIARLGGGIIVNADEYLVSDLIDIARSLGPASSLLIKKAYLLSENDLHMIARFSYGSHGSRVSFDFSKY